MREQPAYKSYFLVGWKNHLTKILKTTLANTWTKASEYSKKANGKGILENLFFIGISAGILISSLTLISVLGFLQLVVLSVISAVSYVILGMVYIADFLYRKSKNWRFICPFCRTNLNLPGHLCPSCGSKHTRLIPSVYGIFRRKCSCGEMLPTTSFNGRSKLRGFCPSCGKELNPVFSRAKPIVITVAGGVGAGKSTFLLSLVNTILERAKRLRWKWKILKTNKELLDELRRFKEGNFPSKTAYKKLPAFNIKLVAPDGDTYLLYLFDYAGEIFNEVYEIAEIEEYSYVDAMIIMIDAHDLESADFVVQKLFESLEFRKFTVNKAAIIATKTAKIKPQEYLKVHAPNLWNLLNAKKKTVGEFLFFSLEIDPANRVFYNVIEPVRELLKKSKNSAAREFAKRFLS